MRFSSEMSHDTLNRVASVMCNERNITVYTECLSSGHLWGGDGMFNQNIIS